MNLESVAFVSLKNCVNRKRQWWSFIVFGQSVCLCSGKETGSKEQFSRNTKFGTSGRPTLCSILSMWAQQKQQKPHVSPHGGRKKKLGRVTPPGLGNLPDTPVICPPASRVFLFPALVTCFIVGVCWLFCFRSRAPVNAKECQQVRRRQIRVVKTARPDERT